MGFGILSVLFLSIALFVAVRFKEMMLVMPFLFLKRKRIPHKKESLSGSLAVLKLSVLFTTTICIMFVDFPLFPEKHAKVSRHVVNVDGSFKELGYLCSFGDEAKLVSLMDVGAPLFVVLNGFGSITPRKSAKAALINGCLWAVRYLSTKGTGYYTPEGEYGRGCNFFGYISLVHGIATIISFFRVPKHLSAIALALIHELTQCKVPVLGYAALFFLASSISYREIESFTTSQNLLYMTFCELVYVSAQEGLLEFRREKSNSGFILFVHCIACMNVALTNLYGVSYSDINVVLRSIERNPLIYFLMANILTGAVNFMIDTNSASSISCFLCVVTVFIGSALLTLGYSVVIARFKGRRPVTNSEKCVKNNRS